MSKSNLGQRLRILREDLGYTQEQISSILNVERQTYTNYENGYRTPPLECLIQLSDLFGTSINYLVRNLKGDDKNTDNAIRELLFDYKRLTVNNQKEIRDYMRFKIWLQQSYPDKT